MTRNLKDSQSRRSRVAENIAVLPKSGIREFFDLVTTMKDVISLGVGEPDFVTPWTIRENAIYSLERGKTSYTSNLGLIQLRREICDYLRSDYGVDYNPDNECLITVGVSEALDLAIRAVINPGDEVVYSAPCYVSYPAEVAMAHGIPVPVEGAEGKVLYVWFDAPIGYISNTKELLPDSWEKWWKDPETKMVHFIGKDNIVFHCIVFPSMLKAEGSYNLPENVPANEFLNLEGDKISTSRNWAVWLNEYLVDMPGKQDVLRYVLTANAPETKDNDFTWKDFQARNNNELVAILGNFVNRALVLTGKYFDNKVPAAGELTDYDHQTLKDFADVKENVERLLDTYHFRDAQKEAMNLARIGNKYLADTEPWKLAKTDMARVATIMNIALQITANLAIVFEPFLPFSMEKLNKMLNVEPLGWNRLGSTDLLKEGHELGKTELLFEKIEDEVIQAQVDKLLATKKANEEANYKAKPIRENIAFDDFLKLDIRVGTVLECTKVPKADKLLQFRIDDGLEKRTIVSGIAQHYKPEELVGKQICFIANLAPRKLKGIVSEGMILSAENFDGKLAVITPEKEVKPGSEVK